MSTLLEFNRWQSPVNLKVGTRIKSAITDTWYQIQALDSLTAKVTLIPSSAPDSGLFIGRKIKDFKLEDLLNPTHLIRLDSLIKLSPYTVLDIWGTWCAGCVLAMPGLDSLQKKYKGKFQLIGLSTSPSEDSAFVIKKGYTWQQLRFTEALATYLEVQSYPTYLVFNRERILVYEGLEGLYKEMENMGKGADK
jgi:thiol-disulfide isomerase/thioredoxin